MITTLHKPELQHRQPHMYRRRSSAQVIAYYPVLRRYLDTMESMTVLLTDQHRRILTLIATTTSLQRVPF